MDRRDFLIRGSIFSGMCWAGSRASAQTQPPFPSTLLSQEGCGRATGYAEANKIVTWQGKTHVAWLDSPPEGFRVRIRSLDLATGKWSPVYTIGEAFDNHGGPTLTVDSQGYLHVAYYPHHHPMRYRRSLRPNDASEWSPPEEVGERVTYPTLVCGPNDTLYLTCRQSNKETPWTTNLYVKAPGSPWEGPQILLQAEKLGYAHFMDALAWGPDRETLHLACRIYDGKPARGHTIGYLRSPDRGKTGPATTAPPWNSQSPPSPSMPSIKPAKEPAWACAPPVWPLPGTAAPFILCATYDTLPAEAWVAYPGADGAWQNRKMRPELPDHLRDWGLITPGGIAFNDTGALFVALTLIKPENLQDTTMWGNPSSEVIVFVSEDGGQRFRACPVTQPDPAVARWLPNIERPTGHNRIAGAPGLVYTSGPPGAKNTDLLANEVYWTSL